MGVHSTVQPGDHGQEVAALQQLLAESGLLPGAASAEVGAAHYGPVTQGAVQTFQIKAQIAPDRIVGPRTWAALESGSAAPPPADLPAPAYALMGQLAAVTMRVAMEEFEAGVVEVPLGSNRGPRVDEYLIGQSGDGQYLLHCRADGRYPDGYQGAPWCARFARWCLVKGAGRIGVGARLAGWGDLASAWKWKVAAEAHGQIVSTPAPGTIGLILVPPAAGHAPHGHVVLVASVEGANITTIEGNSANRVTRRRRAVSELAGFVQIG